MTFLLPIRSSIKSNACLEFDLVSASFVTFISKLVPFGCFRKDKRLRQNWTTILLSSAS